MNPRRPRPSGAGLLRTGALLLVAVLPVLRAGWLNFGATEAELDATLAGDDLVEDAQLVATRAVTIDAAPDQVWPWLVQLGADRGGFYSYDALENLIGCGVHSAERIEPAWQQLAVGDEIALHPRTRMRVAELTAGRSLVLSAAGAPGPAAPSAISWAFVLRRGRSGRTRLVIRERYGYPNGWSALAGEPIALISFVMTEKMMRGIRDRAERS